MRTSTTPPPQPACRRVCSRRPARRVSPCLSRTMYHRAPRILLLLLLVGWIAAQEDKLGLQACLDGFVVHRDKIIRTQDSRDMGAKYLTEFDVESRIECMKWCCETDNCDVFIFEEKKPGSCYLFHCGPPHDFKCKFTSHANYSSAVLTNYNNLQGSANLEEQIRHYQQEHELKSLRKLEQPSKEYNYFTNVPLSTSTTPAPTPLSSSTTPEPIKIPTCSRNQFECRSNEDCIAIYNVCDGIPQCPDGSDESADLGCPVDRTTMPPPPAPPQPQPQVVAASPKPYIPLLPDVIRYQQMMQQQQQQQQQQHGQYPMLYPGGHSQDGSKNWPGNPSLHQMAVAQEMGYGGRTGYNPQQLAGSDESGGPGMGQPQQPLPVNYKPPGYQWNNYQAPIYEQNPKTLDVMHAQNALPPAYEQEQPPRIFKHTGQGVRMDEMEPPNGMYGQDPNRVYAPYYPAVNHHAEPSWHENNQLPQPGPMPNVVVTPIPPHEQQQHQEQQQSDARPKTHSTTSTTPPPCDPSEKQDDTLKIQNSSDKKLVPNDDVHKGVHSTVAKTKPNGDQPVSHESRPAPESIKADNHKVHEAELRTMADTHAQERKDLAIAEHMRRHGAKLEDLEMSRPKGAVISLALGLTVTAVMAVLIACRLRVVKRRGRGRHGSYAHDADYLVNGMYL